MSGFIVGQNHSIIYKRVANIENQLKNEHRPKIRERVAKRLSVPSYFELLVSPTESSYRQISNPQKNEFKELDSNPDVVYKNYETKNNLKRSKSF